MANLTDKAEWKEIKVKNQFDTISTEKYMIANKPGKKLIQDNLTLEYFWIDGNENLGGDKFSAFRKSSNNEYVFD